MNTSARTARSRSSLACQRGRWPPRGSRGPRWGPPGSTGACARRPATGPATPRSSAPAPRARSARSGRAAGSPGCPPYRMALAATTPSAVPPTRSTGACAGRGEQGPGRVAELLGRHGVRAVRRDGTDRREPLGRGRLQGDGATGRVADQGDLVQVEQAFEHRGRVLEQRLEDRADRRGRRLRAVALGRDRVQVDTGGQAVLTREQQPHPVVGDAHQPGLDDRDGQPAVGLGRDVDARDQDHDGVRRRRPGRRRASRSSARRRPAVAGPGSGSSGARCRRAPRPRGSRRPNGRRGPACSSETRTRAGLRSPPHRARTRRWVVSAPK